MSSLFTAILKFCTTTFLFGYFKRRYTQKEVSHLNSLVKLKGKLRSLLIRLRFLNLCLQCRVVPVNIHNRITKAKVKRSAHIEQAFLSDEISKITNQLGSLRKLYRSNWREARLFLSFFDTVRLCRYLASQDNKVWATIYDKHERSIHALVTKRYGSSKISPDHVITNLSDLVLSEPEKFVLSHGLDFCVPNLNTTSEEVFAEFESLVSQLDKLQPTSTADCSALKAKLVHLAHTVCGVSIDSGDMSMYRQHLRVVKTLKSNQEIIITRPDKGKGVVILNKADYINKMNALLSDTSKFEMLGPVSTHDKTSKNEQTLQKYLLKLVKNGSLSHEVYNKIRPTGSQRPRMYGLPKIHKQNTPLRPILSMIGSAQHELAKWLSEVLKPVTDHYSTFCVRDSFTFANEVQLLPFDTTSCFMGSFDISSLFTNVPLDETIEICANFLFEESTADTSLSFNKQQFVDLMNFATKSVEFSFNETMYRQTDGVAMGSPLGPTLANIFVGFCESLLFSKSQPPLVYQRYVDDTFAVFPSQADFESFHGQLNDLHPALKFTFETEDHNQLPFLDVLVIKEKGKFVTTIYRKPTFSGMYTRWDSFCPRSRKTNLIKTLVHRAAKICSPSQLPSELARIKEIFLNNGFPEYVIQKSIKQKLASLCGEPEMGPARCPVYIRLPYKGNISDSFERQIKASVRRCYPAATARVVHTTKSILPSSQKDVLPSLQVNNVIYKYTCRCKAVYVGRTTQRLQDRIKQHVPDSLIRTLCPSQAQETNDNRSTRTCNSTSHAATAHSAASRSAIAEHLCQSPDCATAFSMDCFSLLSKARSKLHLQVLEAWYIHNLKPDLCKQKQLLYSLKLLQ